jgi:hypothetical protein
VKEIHSARGKAFLKVISHSDELGRNTEKISKKKTRGPTYRE